MVVSWNKYSYELRVRHLQTLCLSGKPERSDSCPVHIAHLNNRTRRNGFTSYVGDKGLSLWVKQRGSSQNTAFDLTLE
jgi:hypothetical protein